MHKGGGWVTTFAMRCYTIILALGGWLYPFGHAALAGAAGVAVKDLNTPRDFPKIDTRAQWRERAKDIREQILVSAGLWPMPAKTPLSAKISGKVTHEDYSVEKVYFQTYPGFYLAGNLYRPVGKGAGPFPAILNPHGHSEHGRLEDSTNSSTVARCINFARQGMIAFAYDMVGYNDTHFPESPAGPPFGATHRNFATNDPADQLWGVSLMGLQTWNSIRALDLLASLPDADKKRLAVTGESGGGTQTYMLGAVDSRLAAQAPVVMVSHTMQGGCVCENMPGLRVEYSNVEIAAAACPRPQILVAATGDWTKTTPTMEGPAIKHIYALFGAANKLRYVRFDAPHNYNQASREAVYRWFDHWLLKRPDKPVKELAYKKDSDEELRVFPDGKLPPDAVSEDQLIKNLIRAHQAELEALQPKDKEALKKYKKIMGPAWKHTLQLEWPKVALQSGVRLKMMKTDFAATELEISRAGEGTPMVVRHLVPFKEKSPRTRVVLAHPDGITPYINRLDEPIGLARRLLDEGLEVVVVEQLPAVDTSNQLSPFFTTYNRTLLQERVRDLVSICKETQDMESKKARVILCGSGRAGLWSLLAAPAADAVIADCDQVGATDDRNLLAPDLFCPGIRNMDTFMGAAILAAPHPLFLHNASPNFATDSLRTAYGLLKRTGWFKAETRLYDDEGILQWILSIK